MTMRTGAVLASDKAGRYQALGALGQPVFHAHVQLKAAITKRLGPDHAACFARPDRDPRDDTVRWVADMPGTARRWTDLAPDEQARLALTMEAMRAEFRGYIAELRAAPPNPGPLGTTPQAFAALLEQALHIPGPEHLHVVGDQPVLSFWGFHQADAQGVEGLALQPAAPPPAAPVAAPAATEVPWWRRWWWLLALLLLLLLLAAALLGPWGCAEKIGLVPAPPAPEKPVEPQPPGPAADGVAPVIPGATGPGTAAPGLPGATGPQTTPGPTDPPKAEPPKADPAGPEAPPKPPETPKAEPPKTEVPQQPPPTPPVPPKPMEIPPEAAARGDVGFLDGQWKSRKGLVDQQDGKPLEQFYRFDEKGKGETVVRRADGVECKAPAEARFDGTKLTVEEKGSPTCPDGRSYGSSRTECERTAAGATVCRGVNPDGSGYRVGLDKVQP